MLVTFYRGIKGLQDDTVLSPKTLYRAQFNVPLLASGASQVQLIMLSLTLALSQLLFWSSLQSGKVTVKLWKYFGFESVDPDRPEGYW